MNALRTALAIATLVVAASCSGGNPSREQAPTPASASTSKNPGHLALLRLPESERAAMFQKAVRSADEPCDAVTRTFHQGTEKKSGDEHWNVACRDGGEFTVMVKNDEAGSTRVMSCALLKAVARVNCFERY